MIFSSLPKPWGHALMNKKEPFVHTAEESTGFLLWQVTALWQRKIAEALRPHGLTQVQYALLASLLWLSNRESLVTQTLLARTVKLDIMMTSQVLSKLEAKGFVDRKSHPADRRAKVLLLTESGREAVWKAVPDVEGADAAFFAPLARESREFNKRLRTLIQPQ